MSKHQKFPHKTFGERRQDTEIEPVSATPEYHEVAALAYELWQRRGCPIGSPDVDWTEAEATLQNGRELQLQA
jgi:hypothetical protein